MTAIDSIGWIAMAITLSSFLLSDMKRLRQVNLTGSLIWIVFGLLTNQGPIILTNAVIGGIHTVWLLKRIKNNG